MFEIKISEENQSREEQRYVNDLKRVLKTNLTIPEHTPRKFTDCFYLYWNGTTTYELYVYINNTWKKVTLT